MAGEPSVNHCQELLSAFQGKPLPPLSFNIRPSCGFAFWMEWNIFMFLLFTLYILGSDAIPFMTASHFLLYIPRRMACHWHRDLQAFSLQWQSFRRVCWHLANTLEEENKSWHFIGSKRERKKSLGGEAWRKGERKERERDSVSLLLYVSALPAVTGTLLKRGDLLGII